MVRPSAAAHGRQAPAAAPATGTGAAKDAPAPAESLDDELGAAFASAFNVGSGGAAKKGAPAAAEKKGEHRPAVPEGTPPGGRPVAEGKPAGAGTVPEGKPAAARTAPAAPAATTPRAKEADKSSAAPSAGGAARVGKASSWYVAVGGRQQGPLTEAQLRERWAKGEIGPDTLCWRQGLAAWVPLSQVDELAELRATQRGASGPKDEAAGGEGAAAEKGSAAPASAGATQAKGGWQPSSAADALASLVEKEKEEARSRPQEAARKPPPEEEVPEPESTGIRVLLRDLPEPPPPEPSRFIPRVEGPSPTPAITTAARKKKSSPALVWGGAGLVLVLALGAAAYAGLLPGFAGDAATETQAPIAAAPKEVPQAEEKGAPPVPAPTPAPEPEKPEPAEALAEAGAAPEAPAAEAKAKAEEAAAAAPVVEPPKSKAAPRAAAKSASAQRAAPRPRQQRSAQRAAPPAARKDDDLLAAGSSRSIDELFEKELSGGGSKPKAAPAPAAYIPPPPGSGSSRPKKLSEGEIMAVVAGHRSAIRGCSTKYKEQGGPDGASITMRWVIEPAGRTSGIRAVKGQEHAPLVGCLTSLIKDWRFPSYDGPQMEPIDFPFQF